MENEKSRLDIYYSREDLFKIVRGLSTNKLNLKSSLDNIMSSFVNKFELAFIKDNGVYKTVGQGEHRYLGSEILRCSKCYIDSLNARGNSSLKFKVVNMLVEYLDNDTKEALEKRLQAHYSVNDIFALYSSEAIDAVERSFLRKILVRMNVASKLIDEHAISSKQNVMVFKGEDIAKAFREHVDMHMYSANEKGKAKLEKVITYLLTGTRDAISRDAIIEGKLHAAFSKIKLTASDNKRNLVSTTSLVRFIKTDFPELKVTSNELNRFFRKFYKKRKDSAGASYIVATASGFTERRMTTAVAEVDEGIVSGDNSSEGTPIIFKGTPVVKPDEEPLKDKSSKYKEYANALTGRVWEMAERIEILEKENEALQTSRNCEEKDEYIKLLEEENEQLLAKLNKFKELLKE